MSRKYKQRQRHSRIQTLRCLTRVQELLSFGYPIGEVSRFIRSQGELVGENEFTLRNSLTRYRDDILLGDIVSRRLPHIVISAKEQYTDKLAELRRLDQQYEALMYRFDLAHARERDTGEIDPQVDKIQKSILDLIRQMHAIKMDLGISGQGHGVSSISPERLEEIRKHYGDGAARAMADPVSRARVLAVLDKMRNAALFGVVDPIDADVAEVRRVAQGEPDESEDEDLSGGEE